MLLNGSTLVGLPESTCTAVVDLSLIPPSVKQICEAAGLIQAGLPKPAAQSQF